jgi:electron transfer DM13
LLTGNGASNLILTGSFVGVGDGIHDAQDIAKFIPIESGGNVLRLKDLAVTNGPDLYVYLSADKSASDFVNLGRLKANIGNQNYPIPAGTDMTKYDTVLIWCKAFSVLFGRADLRS